MKSAYADPKTMKELVIIRRIVERSCEEIFFKLIKAGLILSLNDIMKKAILEDEGKGKSDIISDIIKLLVG